MLGFKLILLATSVSIFTVAPAVAAPENTIQTNTELPSLNVGAPKMLEGARLQSFMSSFENLLRLELLTPEYLNRSLNIIFGPSTLLEQRIPNLRDQLLTLPHNLIIFIDKHEQFKRSDKKLDLLMAGFNIYLTEIVGRLVNDATKSTLSSTKRFATTMTSSEEFNSHAEMMALIIAVAKRLGITIDNPLAGNYIKDHLWVYGVDSTAPRGWSGMRPGEYIRVFDYDVGQFMSPKEVAGSGVDVPKDTLMRYNERHQLYMDFLKAVGDAWTRTISSLLHAERSSFVAAEKEYSRTLPRIEGDMPLSAPPPPAPFAAPPAPMGDMGDSAPLSPPVPVAGEPAFAPPPPPPPPPPAAPPPPGAAVPRAAMTNAQKIEQLEREKDEASESGNLAAVKSLLPKIAELRNLDPNAPFAPPKRQAPAMDRGPQQAQGDNAGPPQIDAAGIKASREAQALKKRMDAANWAGKNPDQLTDEDFSRYTEHQIQMAKEARARDGVQPPPEKRGGFKLKPRGPQKELTPLQAQQKLVRELTMEISSRESGLQMEERRRVQDRDKENMARIKRELPALRQNLENEQAKLRRMEEEQAQ